MARSNGSKGGGGTGPSRVRFIVLEAELQDGDLSQITQAIQNALRPQTNANLPRATQQARLSAPTAIAEEEIIAPEDETPVDEADAVEETARAQASRGPRAPRKFRTPQVLPDVDLVSPTSFADFAKQVNPSSDQKKYLTVAAWFKEHRGVAAITADHAYTCFRAVKWNTNIEDFQSPLRALKQRQLMTQAGRGLFEINHLGIAEVEKSE
ncbi:hypothetical protein QA641_36240 [Bradyrhizobium sp. CB1650]|uniref:hypothetical protein n=1 Tax=Bradyrhizobium sp. CB1650 TaxID=3039153 RepID=UPI0024350EEF|nr:hypothetical protein [Bradyrhizobium sp. CB1650]WGD50974.1 hypothetical protein QA641_36240 [Bradyrhizobium sp. CB1650]